MRWRAWWMGDARRRVRGSGEPGVSVPRIDGQARRWVVVGWGCFRRTPAIQTHPPNRTEQAARGQSIGGGHCLGEKGHRESAAKRPYVARRSRAAPLLATTTTGQSSFFVACLPATDTGCAENGKLREATTLGPWTGARLDIFAQDGEVDRFGQAPRRIGGKHWSWAASAAAGMVHCVLLWDLIESNRFGAGRRRH